MTGETRDWRGVALLLALAHFAAFADRALTSVYAPALKDSFGLSDGELGFLQGPAFVVVYAVGMLVVGQGLVPLSRARLIVGGVLIFSVASLIFALAPNYAVLGMSRLVLGLGQAAFVPTAVAALMAAASPAERPFAISWFTTGSATGRSGALLLGGALLALTHWAALPGLAPWRYAVLGLTLPNLLLAWLIWRRLGRGAEPVRLPARLGAAMRQVIGDPGGLGLHFLAAASVILMVQAGAAWAPSLTHRALGLDPAGAALAVGLVVMVAAPLGHLGVGRWMGLGWVRRTGPAPVAVAGVVIAVAGTWLMGAASSRLPGLFGLALLTAGGGGAALAFLASLDPITAPAERTALVSVFLAFVSLVGVGGGPLITGLVSDAVDAAGAGLGLALALVVSAAGAMGVALVVAGGPGWRRRAEAQGGLAA